LHLDAYHRDLHSFPTRRSSDLDRQRHRVRPGRRGVDLGLRDREPGLAAPAPRHHLDQRLPPLPAAGGVGRLQALRHRPRARADGPRGVHRGQAHLREHRAGRHRLVPAQGLILAPDRPGAPRARPAPTSPARTEPRPAPARRPPRPGGPHPPRTSDRQDAADMPAQDLPSETPLAEFDYLIVGGGSAGAALAARLSEDPDVDVALLEAGPSDLQHQEVLELKRWPELLESGLDWDYPIEPQENGNSFMRHARAKVLGGCSSHNSCIAFHPPAEDMDLWEELGAEGWNAATMMPL